jgi:hypothetical protein
LRPHPPTRDSLHGEQGDHNDIDEAWSYDELQGDDVMQAIRPTHATRPGAQTWVYSTRGDRSSTWFHGLIEQGYAGLPGVALFDFGIPDGADPTDIDVIERHHPAVGFTIEREFLIAEQAGMADKPGSSPAPTATGRPAPPSGSSRPAPWNDARTTAELPAGRPAYGLAVAGDGSASALVAAVLDATGRPHVEVIDHRARAGPGWWSGCASCATRGRGSRWTAAARRRRSPTRSSCAASSCCRWGSTTPPPPARTFTTGSPTRPGRGCCSASMRRWTPPPTPPNAGSSATAGWVWKRNPHSAPLEAMTLAAWAVARNPAAPEQPFVIFA